MELNEINESIMDDKFYKYPIGLYLNPPFDVLSINSRLLYMLLLDRFSLSIKNNCCDENGDLYIIFSTAEMMDILKISEHTIANIQNELKECGLIYCKKRGFGKKSMIYVNDIAALTNNENVNRKNCSSRTAKNPIHNRYLEFPKKLILDERYKHMNNETKLIYVYLSEKCSSSSKNKKFCDEDGTYALLSKTERENYFKIKDFKTFQKRIKELVDNGLINCKRTSKGNKYYVLAINQQKIPIEANRKNCSSKTAKNPNLELQKIPVNNTDILYTKYSEDVDIDNSNYQKKHAICEELERNGKDIQVYLLLHKNVRFYYRNHPFRDEDISEIDKIYKEAISNPKIKKNVITQIFRYVMKCIIKYKPNNIVSYFKTSFHNNIALKTEVIPSSRELKELFRKMGAKIP